MNPGADVTQPVRSVALKTMRIVHRVLCVVILMYVYVAEVILQPSPDRVAPSRFVEELSGFCVATVIITIVFRRRLLRSAIQGIQSDNSIELTRWRKANILSMVIAVSVTLYGVAFRLMGASLQVAWLFFLAALALMWMWRPRMPD